MKLKRWVVKAAEHVMRGVFLPILRWAGKDVVPQFTAAVATTSFIEPETSINKWVLMAAFEDHKQMLVTDPVACQATLNACMNAFRDTPAATAAMAMLGQLMAQGYPPEECVVRCHANTIMLGILIERRLSGATSTSAQTGDADVGTVQGGDASGSAYVCDHDYCDLEECPCACHKIDAEFVTPPALPQG